MLTNIIIHLFRSNLHSSPSFQALLLKWHLKRVLQKLKSRTQSRLATEPPTGRRSRAQLTTLWLAVRLVNLEDLLERKGHDPRCWMKWTKPKSVLKGNCQTWLQTGVSFKGTHACIFVWRACCYRIEGVLWPVALCRQTRGWGQGFRIQELSAGCQHVPDEVTHVWNIKSI